MNLNQFKKKRRKDNILLFFNHLFSYKTFFFILMFLTLMLLERVINDDYKEAVCGTVTGVDREEGCGCSDVTTYKYYYAYVSHNNKVTKFQVEKADYEHYIKDPNSQYCGEVTNSGYILKCILLGVLSIVSIFMGIGLVVD